MVSGHGVRGGRGRCFTLWRDFMKCVESAGSAGSGVCPEQREDYMECLHHAKLVNVEIYHGAVFNLVKVIIIMYMLTVYRSIIYSVLTIIVLCSQ